MARRTITILSGEDLVGEQYADRGSLATVKDLSSRRARHGARCPWQ
jgi:hypothetical protein